MPTPVACLLPADLKTRFGALGVAIVEHALSSADLQRMERSFPVAQPLPAETVSQGFAGFAPADVSWFGRHEVLGELAAMLGGGPMRLVRAIALGNSPEANWLAPWHQDQAEDAGQRPIEVLRRMVTLRVHLDDCGEDGGPLEVLPGSHEEGRLDRAGMAGLALEVAPLLCLAVRGDILAMRPLLVRRSQRARVPTARRAIDLEFASAFALVA